MLRKWVPYIDGSAHRIVTLDDIGVVLTLIHDPEDVVEIRVFAEPGGDGGVFVDVEIDVGVQE